MMNARMNYDDIKSVLCNLVMSKETGFAVEVAVRLLLLALFIYADFKVSVPIVIHPEDMWRYRHPYKDSIVPYGELLAFIFLASIVVFLVFGLDKRFKRISERQQAILAFTLSLLMTGVIVNFMKFWIGRPRPNYLVLCYGDTYLQVKDATKPCTDQSDWVGDRSKSFPSGHSSTAFSAFVFHALYICGKVGTFNSIGGGSGGKGWRLLISIIPIMISTWVAATRFTDYRHHVEDVLVGSLLGSIIAYICYRLYYPSLSSDVSCFPIVWIENGYDPTSKTMTLIVRPRQKPNSNSDESVLIPTDQRNSANQSLLTPSSDMIVPTSGSGNLMGVVYTKGNINVEVHMSRRRPLSPSLEKSPNRSALSNASVAFYWDKASDESLTENEMMETVNELRAALSSLEPVSHSTTPNQNEYY